MKRKKFDVEVTSYMVICPKVGQPLSITAANCEKCGFHKGIIHIGKPIMDVESGEIICKEDVPVRAEDMDLEPNEHGRMNTFNIMCGYPRILGTSVMGNISMEEVT